MSRSSLSCSLFLRGARGCEPHASRDRDARHGACQNRSLRSRACIAGKRRAALDRLRVARSARPADPRPQAARGAAASASLSRSVARRASALRLASAAAARAGCRFIAIVRFPPPCSSCSYVRRTWRRLIHRSRRHGTRHHVFAAAHSARPRAARRSSVLGGLVTRTRSVRRPSLRNRPCRAGAAGRRARRLRQLALCSLRRPAVRFAHPRPARSPAPPPPSPRRRPARWCARTVRQRSFDW